MNATIVQAVSDAYLACMRSEEWLGCLTDQDWERVFFNGSTALRAKQPPKEKSWLEQNGINPFGNAVRQHREWCRSQLPRGRDMVDVLDRHGNVVGVKCIDIEAFDPLEGTSGGPMLYLT